MLDLAEHGSTLWPWLVARAGRDRSSTLVSGVLLGAPTLRLRGDYLAIVTLGFGEIIRITAINSDVARAAARASPDVPHPPGIESAIPHGLTAASSTWHQPF